MVYCQKHRVKDVKPTTVSNIWTRNQKSGLNYYKKRKLSVLSCAGNKATLVQTMNLIDGDGGNRVTQGGESCDALQLEESENLHKSE